MCKFSNNSLWILISNLFLFVLCYISSPQPETLSSVHPRVEHIKSAGAMLSCLSHVKSLSHCPPFTDLHDSALRKLTSKSISNHYVCRPDLSRVRAGNCAEYKYYLKRRFPQYPLMFSLAKLVSARYRSSASAGTRTRGLGDSCTKLNVVAVTVGGSVERKTTVSRLR